LNTNSGLTIYT